MDVAGPGRAVIGRFAGVIVVGQIGHHDFVANDIEGIFRLAGKHAQGRQEFHKLGAGSAVFQHFRYFDVAGHKLRVASHVTGTFFIETHGFFAEHHGVITGIAGEEERQQRFDGGDMAEDVGDGLIGNGDGDAIIVVGHIFLFCLVVNFWKRGKIKKEI